MNNLLHLIIVILLVGGASVVKVVVQKLQEQAIKRQRQAAAEQRALEALRTGRETPSPAAPPTRATLTQDPRVQQQSLEELARRRAAQLQELRRVQQQRQGGTAPSPSRGVVTRIPGSTGPTVPGTRPPAIPPAPMRRSPPPRPAPQPRPPQHASQRPPQHSPQRPTQQQAAQRGRPSPQPQQPAKQRPTPPVLDVPAESLQRAIADAPPIATASTSPSAIFTRPSGAAAWKRAFILSELFSPPLSVRTGENSPLARRF